VRESLPQIGITQGRAPLAPADQPLAAYLTAVRAAGGEPVLLPASLDRDEFDSLSAGMAGLLFAGGGDLDPRLYGDVPGDRLDDVDPKRDERELALARQAAAHQRPFLAICRGLQVVNVALGGSLIQDLARDLPGSLRHTTAKGAEPTLHPVEIDPSSHLGTLLGSRSLTANSYHHQAARRLGAGLLPVAHTSDGVVEALELSGHPFGMAVQWHPERMLSEPAMLTLFRAFVAAASTEAGPRG